MRARRNLHGFRPLRNNPIVLTIVKFLHSTIPLHFSAFRAFAGSVTAIGSDGSLLATAQGST